MEMAEIGVQVLRTEVPRQLSVLSGADSGQADRWIMDELARNPPQTDLGRFAFVALYDTSQHEVGHATDSSDEAVRSFTEILAPLQPSRSTTQIELGTVFRIGDVHGMPFVLAIAGDHGQTIGYVKGIFVPSPKTDAEILRTARRASGLAIVFVLVTALIIYPSSAASLPSLKDS